MSKDLIVENADLAIGTSAVVDATNTCIQCRDARSKPSPNRPLCATPFPVVELFSPRDVNPDEAK